jgi:hypothetical protein
MKIHEALANVMDDVRSVGKTERNTHQNYNFRGIDAVVNAVGPAMRRHNVVLVPRVLNVDAENVTVGRNNTQMRSVTVIVEYEFVGPEGDSLKAVSVGESMDSGDKAVPKAMSVALRTCLLQALMLPTDEPDPDAHSYERVQHVDPLTPETWPEKMTVADAKNVVVAACGGDKKLAAEMWEQAALGDGPFDRGVVKELMLVCADSVSDPDERPF